MKTQKKMCLWLVGLWVFSFFFLLLCTSKYLAPITLKPSPRKSTEMEFEKAAPCQKYSQLSHFYLEQHDLSITFQCWSLSFCLHMVGMRCGWGWDAGGSVAWTLMMQHRSLEPWVLWLLQALHESPLSQAHQGWHPAPSPPTLVRVGGNAREGSTVPRVKDTDSGDGPSRAPHPRTHMHESLWTSWMFRKRWRRQLRTDVQALVWAQKTQLLHWPCLQVAGCVVLRKSPWSLGEERRGEETAWVSEYGCMSMCTCVCVCAWVHVRARMCVHRCMYRYMFMCVCVCARARVHVCAHAWVRVCVLVCLCMGACVWLCMGACVCAQVCVDVCMHGCVCAHRYVCMGALCVHGYVCVHT